jgi:hypothetical protein
MSTLHRETLTHEENPFLDFDIDVDVSRETHRVKPAQRVGVAAIHFFSPTEYEESVKPLPRDGKRLAHLHDEHVQSTREHGIHKPRGVLLELQIKNGYIGYNCSQAFEQTAENDQGEFEKRWYIAVRTEIEGGEISRIEFFYQSKDSSDTPPDSGVWRRDTQRQLPYDTLTFMKDENPWKPDPTILFVHPNFENTPIYESRLLNRGYDIPTMPEAHQDPSVAIGSLNGSPLLVMTAVKARSLRPLANASNEKRMPYHQEFFMGTSIDNLEIIATGPEHRKGTRIVYLGDERWGIFNRPQGAQGQEFHPGVITYAEFTANTKEEFIQGLQEALLDISMVIPDLCQSDEWVGPNFGWPLIPKGEKDGNDTSKRRIGMIGHIAAMTDSATGQREYCATSFIYDPESNTTEEVKIIVAKEGFEGLVGRRVDRDDLDRVIYPGGAVPLPNGKLRLYCGISDLTAGYIDIDDPFAGLRLEVANE